MKGYVAFEVRAGSVFVATLLRSDGIVLYNVKQNGEFCRFLVADTDAEKTEAVLVSRGKDYKKREKPSLKRTIVVSYKRIGFFVGVILAFSLLFVWSEIVTEVRVSGTNLVSEAEVIACLGDECRMPKKKKEIDVKEWEKKLIAQPGVSNASLEIKGNIVFIRILEELEEPEPLNYTQISDVISDFDGVVTKVVCHAGTPLVRQGDTVRKGDVLISSSVTAADGKETKVRALGEVYGRVWVTEESVFTPTVIVTEETGKEKCYIVSENARSRIIPPFPSCNDEESILFDGRFFPLKFIKIIYKETNEKEMDFDYYAQRETLIAEKTAQLEATLPEGVEKIRTWFSEKTVDKNVLLVIYYEIVINLSAG